MSFASAPLDRYQVTVFQPTLEESIPPDHPVRLYDEILAQVDWSAWESHYCLTAGQPPIHPRVLASIILYGLGRGIRSSRMLEYLCSNSLDYLWLAQGHRPDHTTLCKFRTKFTAELKDLFRQLAQVALHMKLASLTLVGLDGTRIKANSSHHATAGEKTLAANLEQLDAQIETLFAQMAQQDAQEHDLFGQSRPSKLPRELANLQARQERLQQALAAVQKKTAEATDKDRKTPRVPVADPDATILPNKEGGFAPNYTAVVATESQSGFIMDADVIIGGDEGSQVVPSVDRLEENFEQRPANLTADTAFSSGENLAELQERDVTAYMPQFNRPDQTNNPAVRADPAEAVPQSKWDQLPRDAQSKKLHRSAFVFVEAENCYYCPMGRNLPYVGQNTKPRKYGLAVYDGYRSADCSACPLAEQCLNGPKWPRTVYREQHEPLREAMDRRMASPAGQKIYRQRSAIAETPFAILKALMNLRQFLTRGIDRVRNEWLWACTAFNLAKLARCLAVLRAAGVKTA